MSTRKKFESQIKALSAEWLDRQPAKLGDGTGSNGGVVLTDTAGIYNARLINGKVIQVYNQVRVAPIPDLQVSIGRRRSMPTVWQIVEVSQVYDAPADQGQIEYHHEQHEEGGGDQLFLDRKQIIQLSVRVSDAAGFIVLVYGAIVRTAAGIKKIDTQLIDLSAHIVTSGAKYVAIESDDNGTLTPNAGALFAGPGAATAADLPTPAAGKYPIAFVLFYEGQSELSDADIAPPIPLPGTNNVGALIHAAESSVPADTDEFGFWKQASGLLKKITWSALLSILNTLYSVVGHSHTLDGLSDVTITSPTNDQVLKYSGGSWINGTGGTSTSTGDLYTFLNSY